MTTPLAAEKLTEDDSRKFDYFFMEACRLKMKGNFQKSAEMYQSCLQIDNGSAVAHFELGKLLLMGGDEENALKLLKQAVILNPKNDWYQLYLANVFVHANQQYQAIEIYENLRKLKPAKAEYLYNLGDLYTKTNQYDKAISVYNEVEELEGVNEALILEKQRLYLLSGEEKKAYEEIIRLVDKYPGQARYLILLGDYYVSVENFKKAQKTYAKVEDLDPENGFLHMSQANLYEQMGEIKQSQDELALAFDSKDIVYEQKMQILFSYMMLAEKNPEAGAPIENLTAIIKRVHPEEAQTYYFYANHIISDTTKTDEAVENLETSVSLNAANEDAWMQLIQIAFSKEDFAKVITYTDDALLGGVKTSYIYFYRGIAFQQQENELQAKEAYLNANAITTSDNPLKPQVLGSLGDVSYSIGDKDSSFSYYRQALALDAHNVMVLNNYAYFLSEEDSALAEAELMSAKCIELEPGNATYLDTYAWILYLNENYLLAKFYMEKAIHNTDTDNDVLFDHYADILWANDDKEEARLYWQKAIEAGGDGTILNEKLSKE